MQYLLHENTVINRLYIKVHQQKGNINFKFLKHDQSLGYSELVFVSPEKTGFTNPLT